MPASALATCLPCIARLIPRLGSDFDAEVVETARAIQRVLALEGRDLHDLVKAVQCSCTASRSPEPASGVNADNWRDAAQWLHRQSGLTAWERNFLETIRQFSGLSEKQRVKLTDILAKVRGRQS